MSMEIESGFGGIAKLAVISRTTLSVAALLSA